MRITPNNPDTCPHEELDYDHTEVRVGGRLVRLDVTVICSDCETLLQATTHAPPRKTL